MNKHDATTKILLMAVVVLLGALVIREYSDPQLRVSAQAGQFDYVQILSVSFIYKGSTGVLMIDKRNGNVWFTAKSNEMKLFYRPPVYVVRLPLELLADGVQPDPR